MSTLLGFIRLRVPLGFRQPTRQSIGLKSVDEKLLALYSFDYNDPGRDSASRFTGELKNGGRLISHPTRDKVLEFKVFDPANSNLEINYPIDFSTNDRSLAIALWVKFQSLPNPIQRPIINKDNATVREWALFIDQVDNPNENAIVLTDVWNFIYFEFDKDLNQSLVELNGVEIQRINKIPISIDSIIPIRIGSDGRPGGFQPSMEIDNVMYFKDTLTLAEKNYLRNDIQPDLSGLPVLQVSRHLLARESLLGTAAEIIPSNPQFIVDLIAKRSWFDCRVGAHSQDNPPTLIASIGDSVSSIQSTKGSYLVSINGPIQRATHLEFASGNFFEITRGQVFNKAIYSFVIEGENTIFSIRSSAGSFIKISANDGVAFTNTAGLTMFLEYGTTVVKNVKSIVTLIIENGHQELRVNGTKVDELNEDFTNIPASPLYIGKENDGTTDSEFFIGKLFSVFISSDDEYYINVIEKFFERYYNAA